MEQSQRDVITAHAVSFVRSHFELLNAGSLHEVRGHLFHPAGMQEQPLDVYVNAMAQLAPFEVLTIEPRAGYFDEPKERGRHGVFGAVWLDVRVNCRLGERSTLFIVWWEPEADRYLIATRPTEMVLEQVRDLETQT